jgi:hypothetical protein
MAQGLPPQRAPGVSDRDHSTSVAARVDRIGIAVFVVALIFLALLAGPLSAQSRGQVQVAARVVSVEPSRQALALAVLPGLQPRRSPLATVRVVREAPKRAERRVVSIDFLRN